MDITTPRFPYNPAHFDDRNRPECHNGLIHRVEEFLLRAALFENSCFEYMIQDSFSFVTINMNLNPLASAPYREEIGSTCCTISDDSLNEEYTATAVRVNGFFENHLPTTREDAITTTMHGLHVTELHRIHVYQNDASFVKIHLFVPVGCTAKLERTLDFLVSDTFNRLDAVFAPATL